MKDLLNANPTGTPVKCEGVPVEINLAVAAQLAKLSRMTGYTPGQVAGAIVAQHLDELEEMEKMDGEMERMDGETEGEKPMD